MSVNNPVFGTIPRQSVVGMENEWVKMFDPPKADPPTPDMVTPTNPVPEVMAATGMQAVPSPAHTLERQLMHGMKMPTWDGAKELVFFVFRDPTNPTASGGVYPAPTTRVPRGAIFHGHTQGSGPPPHTIHWHGIEPTPINDGVGHCSMEIGDYTYQWQPNFIGTYFYHCHRNTVQHFNFGLYGLLPIMPPDAYFATLDNPAIPIGACRDGKFRTAANLSIIRGPTGGAVPMVAGSGSGFEGALIANPYPGFIGGLLTDPDPLRQFPTNPHAMTVPYDVEAIWVLADRDSVWSDLAEDARTTFPAHGPHPGIDDDFARKPGRDGFFAFNQFNPDYWFVTGVPVKAHRGGTGTVDPAGAPPAGGGLPDGLIPPALNSGISGTQVAISAKVGQTILVRCLNGAYDVIDVTFPLDVTVIAWDGRALGVPPFGFNHPYMVPAGTPIHLSVARRFDALIRSDSEVNGVATVKFLSARHGGQAGTAPVAVTAEIPINIVWAAPTVSSISGSVFGSRAGEPLPGVTMVLTSDTGRQTVVTDASGNYSFAGLANGRYTIIPNLAGFQFFPREREATIVGADQTGQFFRGRAT
ncbi:MAG: carboxypeptidase regulatory-like domain-containing protein [Chloroflexi bacterium]|nr:carboxypeptidase regulatory-like domain-containing protein [Chloroflexota bacterium]